MDLSILLKEIEVKYMKFIKQIIWRIESILIDFRIDFMLFLKSKDKIQIIKSKFIKCKNCEYFNEPNFGGDYNSTCFKCISSNYRKYKRR